MAREMEKPKMKKVNILFRLWKYLYDSRILLLAAAVMTVISNLFALIGPLLSGYAIDAIEPGKGKVIMSQVFFYVGLMMVFYLISAVMSYVLSVIMINISRRAVYKMRRDAFEKLTSLPVGFFDKHQTGDIISIISYDVDTVNASLSSDLIQMCTSFVTVIGSLIMMLSISPSMVLIFAVTIPISILFTRYRTKLVRPLFSLRSKKLGELNGFVEEINGGHRTTKAYGREKQVVERFDAKNKEAVDAYYNADYYGSVMGPSVNFINNLSLAGVSTFGAILYLYKMMSLGDVSSFVLYSRKFSGPINEIASIISELQSAFSAAERVFRLIDEEPEKADSVDAAELDSVDGDVKMENVRFGYDEAKTIIHDLTLHAKPGTLVAIVGPTGAGKTTIINLLMRFYDINSGAILVDDKDISSVTRKSLRRAYTMVLQDTWLFNGTIYENLAYGCENVTREQVENAAKMAHMHSFIMRLPNGYDTQLSDNAVNLSKGQRQLLTIARAMLIDAKMLILDEATSNVDTQTEVRIQAAMRELMKDKTCFVIAHRLSTIRSADIILVLRDGDIVEQGTHEQLMEKKGFYHELYVSQFS